MVNGTYPTWDELAAKYGTCRHPDCPDTNWHGRDRLHLRGPACPFSLDSTYRIAPLNRKDNTMATKQLSDIAPTHTTLRQLCNREHILVSRVAATLGGHMTLDVVDAARRAGLEPVYYEMGGPDVLDDIIVSTETVDRLKEREKICAYNFIDLLCSALDVTPAAAYEAVQDAGFLIPTNITIDEPDDAAPSPFADMDPRLVVTTMEDYMTSRSEEDVIVWEDNFVFKRRIKAITTASNVTGPCPPSLAAGPWTSQMLRVADWIMGETH